MPNSLQFHFSLSVLELYLPPPPRGISYTNVHPILIRTPLYPYDQLQNDTWLLTLITHIIESLQLRTCDQGRVSQVYLFNNLTSKSSTANITLRTLSITLLPQFTALVANIAPIWQWTSHCSMVAGCVSRWFSQPSLHIEVGFSKQTKIVSSPLCSMEW